jgi:hypothetical protein
MTKVSREMHDPNSHEQKKAVPAELLLTRELYLLRFLPNPLFL